MAIKQGYSLMKELKSTLGGLELARYQALQRFSVFF